MHADGGVGGFTGVFPDLQPWLKWYFDHEGMDVYLRVVEDVAGDATGDGVVDINDLVAVINAWGECLGCPEDINGDGYVDIDDLVMVINNWTEE